MTLCVPPHARYTCYGLCALFHLTSGLLVNKFFEENIFETRRIKNIHFQQKIEFIYHNIFVFALDDTREWFRYHHLFAELLRHRVRQKGETLLATLHNRAADWFASHDLKSEAMQHAFAAAKQILPNLHVAKILKGQGHILDKHASEQVFTEIREFLKKPA